MAEANEIRQNLFKEALQTLITRAVNNRQKDDKPLYSKVYGRSTEEKCVNSDNCFVLNSFAHIFKALLVFNILNSVQTFE